MTMDDFRKNSASRLSRAHVLLQNGHPDGAWEEAGYALEFHLKARVMEARSVPVWPENKRVARKQGLGLEDLMGHDLGKLVAAGPGAVVKLSLMAEWSNVVRWTPEARYQPLGSVTPQQAEELIKDVETLLKHL